MFKQIVNTALRRGVETAVSVTAESAASATTKAFAQRFEVVLPTTVFVRASQCNVTVRQTPGNVVELQASLRASFGWEFIAEQDDAGVYVVAKRKPVVGSLSSASFTLIVPPDVNLVFHLTPGSIKLLNVNGKVTIPTNRAD